MTDAKNKAKAKKKKTPKSAAAAAFTRQREVELMRMMQHHRMLAISATVVALGLALVGTGVPELDDGLRANGAIGLVLAGLLMLMYRIHRYGRLGSTAPPLETTRRRRA